MIYRSWVPLEARRAARLDGEKSTSTVRVPWEGTLCVPSQVELRSRHIEAGSTGAPPEKGARLQGRPSLGYLLFRHNLLDRLATKSDFSGRITGQAG